MKFTWMKWSALPVAVLMAGSVAMAQDQSSSGSQQPAPAAQPKTAVAQRKENQQDRIANGVQSGQLTAGETSKLETKEAAINGETKADRAANGGTLTASEKQQVNHEQNAASKNIYHKKHNAKTQPQAQPKP